jgi:uncharacterized protein YjeT (DUF2065 family)
VARWVKVWGVALALIFVIDGLFNMIRFRAWFNPEGGNLLSLVAAPLGITGLLWMMQRYPVGWRKWVYGIGIFVAAEIAVAILFDLLFRLTGINLRSI